MNVASDEIRKVFESVKLQMLESNKSGDWWRTAALISSLLGFVAATAIAVVTSFFGGSINPKHATDAQALTFVRNSLGKYSWLVGILAAIVGVSSAVTERSGPMKGENVWVRESSSE